MNTAPDIDPVFHAIVSLVNVANRRFGDQACAISDLPTEAGHNPLKVDNIRALVAIMLAAVENDWRVPSIKQALGNIPDETDCIYEYIHALAFAARICIQDASVQWVHNRFGPASADELELVLEDDDQAYALDQERNATVNDAAKDTGE